MMHLNIRCVVVVGVGVVVVGVGGVVALLMPLVDGSVREQLLFYFLHRVLKTWSP
jgi:hypothetical protein